jgi:hypothetical protein
VKANTFSNNNYFFSARSPTDDKIFWSLATDYEGRLIIRTRNGAGANAQKVDTSAIFDKATWYHVVVTANTLKYSVYVNGEEVLVTGANTGKWIPDITTGNLRYTVGALDASDFTGVLDGIVDDVRVFGSVLALSDVRAFYDETNEKGPSIPVGAIPVIHFSLSEKTIPFGGSVSVTWDVTNADACTASWTVAPVEMSGTTVFLKLATDQGYTLKCVKTGGVESIVGENVHVLGKGEIAPTSQLGGSATFVSPTNIVLGAKGPSLMRSLSIGYRGADVMLLQRYLIEKSFFSVDATGYFGTLTQMAVKAFQKANNIEQVGIVGPKTRAKILVTP